MDTQNSHPHIAIGVSSEQGEDFDQTLLVLKVIDRLL